MHIKFTQTKNTQHTPFGIDGVGDKWMDGCWWCFLLFFFFRFNLFFQRILRAAQKKLVCIGFGLFHMCACAMCTCVEIHQTSETHTLPKKEKKKKRKKTSKRSHNNFLFSNVEIKLK